MKSKSTAKTGAVIAIIIALTIALVSTVAFAAAASPASVFAAAYDNTVAKLAGREFSAPQVSLTGKPVTGSGKVWINSVDLPREARNTEADAITAQLKDFSLNSYYEYSPEDKQAYISAGFGYAGFEQELFSAFISRDIIAASVPLISDLVIKTSAATVADDYNSSAIASLTGEQIDDETKTKLEESLPVIIDSLFADVSDYANHGKDTKFADTDLGEYEIYRADISTILEAKDAITANATFKESSGTTVITLSADDINAFLSSLTDLAVKYVSAQADEYDLAEEDLNQAADIIGAISVKSDVTVTATIANKLISKLTVSEIALSVSDDEAITVSGLAVEFTYTDKADTVKIKGAVKATDTESVSFDITATDKSTADILNQSVTAKISSGGDTFNCTADAYYNTKNSTDNFNITIDLDVKADGKKISENLVITGNVKASDTEYSIGNGNIKSTTKYDGQTYVIDLGFESNAKVTDKLNHDYSNATNLRDVTEEQLTEITETIQAIYDQFSVMFEGFEITADATPDSVAPINSMDITPFNAAPGNSIDITPYKSMLEAYGIDLTDPNLLERFSGYGIDLSEYATYTNGEWEFDYNAIISEFSAIR